MSVQVQFGARRETRKSRNLPVRRPALRIADIPVGKLRGIPASREAAARNRSAWGDWKVPHPAGRETGVTQRDASMRNGCA